MQTANIQTPTPEEAALPSNLESAPAQGQHAMQGGSISQWNVIVSSPHSAQELQPPSQSSSITGPYTSFSNQRGNPVFSSFNPAAQLASPSVSETSSSLLVEKHKLRRRFCLRKKQTMLVPTDRDTSSTSTGIGDTSKSKVEISVGSLVATRVTSTSKQAVKQVSKFMQSIPAVRIENMAKVVLYRPPVPVSTVFLR